MGVTQYLFQVITKLLLLQALFLPCHSPVRRHRHTYLLVLKSFYEMALSDSLFFFIKEMWNNSKVWFSQALCRFDLFAMKTFEVFSHVSWKRVNTHNTYLVHVELRLSPRQLSVTCCEFSNEIMAVLKKKKVLQSNAQHLLIETCIRSIYEKEKHSQYELTCKEEAMAKDVICLKKSFIFPSVWCSLY